MNDIRARLMWPLRSPRRFAVAALVVLVGLVLVGRVLAGAAGAPATSGSGPVSTVTKGAGASPTPAPSGAPDAPTVAAVAFVSAWGNSGAPEATWRASVAQEATPALASALNDPARVPASVVTGPGRETRREAQGAEVIVPTNTGDYVVTMENGSGSWKASDIEPASENGATP